MVVEPSTWKNSFESLAHKVYYWGHIHRQGVQFHDFRIDTRQMRNSQVTDRRGIESFRCVDSSYCAANILDQLVVLQDISDWGCVCNRIYFHESRDKPRLIDLCVPQRVQRQARSSIVDGLYELTELLIFHVRTLLFTHPRDQFYGVQEFFCVVGHVNCASGKVL